MIRKADHTSTGAGERRLGVLTSHVPGAGRQGGAL